MHFEHRAAQDGARAGGAAPDFGKTATVSRFALL
jgi:hypothetical protein